MPNGPSKLTEFEFEDFRGWLFVSLERETFERILKLVQELADSEELSEVEVSEVWQLFICDSSRCPKPVPSSWWRDRMLLVGCAIVAFILLFVLMMGILAISGLVRLPR